MHPKYKTKYRVGNWSPYDRALVQRGDVTLWLAPDAIARWEAAGVGKRSGQLQYSDVAIETALTLRLLFHLPLRQTEGFLRSIFGVYPGFPTLFWGLSVFFVGDLMGKALWKLVENAARFPRRGGRVLCVHGAVSFHRARPCGPRWLPGRGAMRHVELDRRVLGLQSTGE